MASLKEGYRSYYTFLIIILMAVMVIFRTSVALPTDHKDQEFTVRSSLGSWGINKEGHFEASNATFKITLTCPATDCTADSSVCGSECTCVDGTLKRACAPIPPPPATGTCTVGSSCTPIGSDCGTGCSCNIADGTCKSDSS